MLSRWYCDKVCFPLDANLRSANTLHRETEVSLGKTDEKALFPLPYLKGFVFGFVYFLMLVLKYACMYFKMLPYSRIM